MVSKTFSRCTRRANQFFGAFSVAFLLVISLVIPVFTRQEPVSAADTGWHNPTDCDDYKADWVNPTNAYSQDDQYAGGNSGTAGDDEQDYDDFGFSGISGNIDGIIVSIDGYASSNSNPANYNVKLSWNGASSWTSTRVSGNIGTSDTDTYVVAGGASDDWDRTWSASEFNNGNFYVYLQVHGGSALGADFFTDHVRVVVYYSVPPTTNLDNIPATAYPADVSTITGDSHDSDGTVADTKVMVYDSTNGVYYNGGGVWGKESAASWRQATCDDGTFNEADENWTYTPGDDGLQWTDTHKYIVYARAQDNDGNWDASPAQDSFTYSAGWTNTPPDINPTGNVTPSNNSFLFELHPTCQVYVEDDDGNNTVCDIYTSLTGSAPWTFRQHYASGGNRTLTYNCNVDNWNDTLYWKVYANDGHDNVSKWFNFTMNGYFPYCALYCNGTEWDGTHTAADNGTITPDYPLDIAPDHISTSQVEYFCGAFFRLHMADEFPNLNTSAKFCIDTIYQHNWIGDNYTSPLQDHPPSWIFGYNVSGWTFQGTGLETTMVYGDNPITSIPAAASDYADSYNLSIPYLWDVNESLAQFDSVSDITTAASHLVIEATDGGVWGVSNYSMTSFIILNVPPDIWDGTDNSTDSDSDGLSDHMEINSTYGYSTDPFRTDTDNDGVSDNTEITDATDPNDYTDYLSNAFPTVDYKTPVNGSTDIAFSGGVTCYAYTNDTDGDPLDITWATNESGSWVNKYTNTSEPANGTESYTFTDFDTANTKYWWKVYVNDGTVNVSEIYHFTTAAAPAWNTINTWNGTIYNTSNWNIVATWNGTLHNDTSFRITNNWNGTLYNDTDWQTVTLWNGTLYNTSHWYATNTWNGTLYNVSKWASTTVWNGTLWNSTGWTATSAWNGTLYNLTNYNTIADWNGTLFNDTVYSAVNNWNGTLYNTSHWYATTWNGSLYNSSHWYTITNWNGTIWNSTDDWLVTSTWNGTLFNDTSWRSINTWNGTLYNTTNWNITSLWNGSIYNTTTFKTISLWNGTIYNISNWNTISTWNGTLYNSTDAWLTTSNWNGTIYNTTVWNITAVWNGSLYNITTWNVTTTWDGTLYNDTNWNITSNWNGTLYNMTSWRNITSWNGTIYNSTDDWLITSNWNGTLYNTSHWYPTTWNGTLYNISHWYIKSNWNGTLYNISNWCTVSLWNGTLFNDTSFRVTATWDGTLYNSTNDWLITSNWNGTLYNDTLFRTTTNWNGTLYNITTWNITTTWNGTLYNTTGWCTSDLWNGTLYNDTSFRVTATWDGTLYNSTDAWLTTSNWNGTLYNSTNWRSTNIWNGTLYNTSHWDTISTWNGTLYNTTGWCTSDLWNGTLYNSSNWYATNNWNGTIYNISRLWTTATNWNGTLYNTSIEWINVTNWNGSLFNISTEIQITDEFPGNNTYIQSLQPTVYFTLTNPFGLLMNYTIYIGNNSANTTTVLDNATGVGNGTYYYNNYYTASNYTDYWWRVYANDSTQELSKTFTFTCGRGGGNVIGGDGGSTMAIAAGGILIGAVALVFVFSRRRRKEKDDEYY